MTMSRERKTEHQRTRRNIERSEQVFDVTPWVELKAEFPDVFLHVMTVRKMLEHRAITVRKGFGGKSYQYWYKALSPHVNKTAVYKDNVYKPSKKHAVLYELEDHITKLTAEGGGRLAMCGCTPHAIDQLIHYLDMPHAKEMFPDV